MLCSSWQAVRLRGADRDPPNGYRRERAGVDDKLLKLRDTDGFPEQFQYRDRPCRDHNKGSSYILFCIAPKKTNAYYRRFI
jgi:hypothetical protein